MSHSRNRYVRHKNMDEDDIEYERIALEQMQEAQRNEQKPSCETGKFCYLTLGTANNVAKNMRKRLADPFLEGYKCKKCQWFHVGHMIGSQGYKEVILKTVPKTT